MSLAVTALLLRRLEARRGEWVQVALLCERLGLNGRIVREHLAAMAGRGMAVLQHNPEGVAEAARAAPPDLAHRSDQMTQRYLRAIWNEMNAPEGPPRPFHGRLEQPLAAPDRPRSQ